MTATLLWLFGHILISNSKFIVPRPLKWGILSVCDIIFSIDIHKNLWKYFFMDAPEKRFFSQIWYGNICILWHNCWTNLATDMLSTSKWPSEPNFLKYFHIVCKKMTGNGRKIAFVSQKFRDFFSYKIAKFYKYFFCNLWYNCWTNSATDTLSI